MNKDRQLAYSSDDLIAHYIHLLLHGDDDITDVHGNYGADFLDSPIRESEQRGSGNSKPKKGVAIEIMREVNGSVLPSGVFICPAVIYRVDLPGGTTLLLATQKLRQLLYDHCYDTVFRDGPNGQIAYAVLPKQLLLDHSEKANF